MPASPLRRPPLTPGLSAQAFVQHYWLLSELRAFCRAQELVATGSKQHLSAAVAHWLRTGERGVPPKASPRAPPAMPPRPWTPQTVLVPGMTCSQELRAWFEQRLGPAFRFNGVMRDFIHNHPGRTLEDAARAWLEARARKGPPTTPAPQFQFNRHMQAFHRSHPGASRRQALEAWWAQTGRGDGAGD